MGHQHDAHHHALQLPDIAGPGMRLHEPHRRLAELDRFTAPGQTGLMRHVTHQDRHVVGTFAKRRQPQRQHRQAIVEIEPELALRHQGRQIAIGRSHHPHVELELSPAADPHHHPILQHPQQLGLHRQRQLADLIQKQCSAIGLLESARLGSHRAGEGAALVAEKLRLEQTLGDGRAIDFDKGLVGARAGMMDRAGKELLAGSGVTQQQHGEIAASQSPGIGEALLQGRRIAQDAEIGQFRAEPLTQVAIFIFEQRGAPLQLFVDPDHLTQQRADRLEKLEIVIECSTPMPQAMRGQHTADPLAFTQRHCDERDRLGRQPGTLD